MTDIETVDPSISNDLINLASKSGKMNNDCLITASVSNTD